MKYRETWIDVLVDGVLFTLIGIALFVAGIFYGMNFGAW